MRRLGLTLIAGAALSLATVAVPGAANAAPCGTPGANTLASFTNSAGGSNGITCTVEDKTFGNFTFNTGNGFGLGAADIAVTGLASPGAPNTDPGIQFNGAFATPVGATSRDLATTFTVAEAAGTLITDASLAISGLSSPPGVPVGTNVTDSETLTFPNGTQMMLPLATGDTPTTAIAFAGVPNLSVTDNLIVQPGFDVSIIQKRFSETGQIPEPASLAILGVSLLGMGVAFRRRFRK
jgi:hypothetical protein